MGNPAVIVSDAMQALLALAKTTKKAGVPAQTFDLCNLRASQINGCSVCVHGHARDLKKAGVSDDRIATVAAWRDTPFFSDAERAALALTEALTRLNDRADQVSDDVWHEATRHYDEQALGSLILSIAIVNLWNRLNLATRQVAGAAWG